MKWSLLRKMKIVTDENVDFVIVETLRKSNIQVIHIREVSPGADDETVLTLATHEKAILLTEDKDFGEIVHRLKKASNGIILVRLSGLDSREKADIISQTIEKHFGEMEKAFTVISANKIRIKKMK